MNHQILVRASEINRFSRDNIITLVTERHVYSTVTGTFSTVISAAFKDHNGYFKTFKFPTERAFENAINDIALFGNSNLKRLKKYIR